MATAYYPAIIERGKSGFGVFFPDLPGCVSAGNTIQDAAFNAEQALSGHLVLSSEYADDIPEPSDLDAIERDPEIDEAARILVRADLPGRFVRLNITLDEALVAAIDRIAPNRSGFLAEAARAALHADNHARRLPPRSSRSTKAASSADTLLEERVIQMTQTEKEAVVTKQARVTEELVLSKTAAAAVESKRDRQRAR